MMLEHNSIFIVSGYHGVAYSQILTPLEGTKNHEPPCFKAGYKQDEIRTAGGCTAYQDYWMDSGPGFRCLG